MKRHAGIWLPDDEDHLLLYLDKGPQFEGAGTYQFHKLQLAMQHVKQRRVAIDVGGHAGLWARVMATYFEKVESFEPMAASRECFAKNVTADNVTLHPYALGASAGTVKMLTHPAHSMWTYIDSGGNEIAEMRTLDSCGFDNVDFIKIDCEGYELHVINGATETIARCRPTMIVEQKPNNGRRYGYSDTAALDALERMGARIVGQKAGDYVLTWRGVTS